MNELVDAIKHLKTGKAACKDGIPNEFGNTHLDQA